MSEDLQTVDPHLYELIREEKLRQKNGLELIASENFTSKAVLQCLGSCLTNKYSEGYPGARYYGGNEIIDKIEVLCQKRALEAFDLSEDTWAVNVQPYSGSPANFAVYTGLLRPHARIMGMDLPSGGHLTHGYYTAKKKISATSIYFESLPYSVNPETGLIDYQQLKERALLFRPEMIIAGASAYSREIDWKKFREICDQVNAFLFVDIAHIAGLIATQNHSSPFPYADIVSTTSHKSLRGPRAGMIFINKERHPELVERINFAVFPSLQGGPHNHQIAALCTQLREVKTPEYKEYCRLVVENCGLLAEGLRKRGYRLVTGGTDNHLVLVDLREMGVSGSKVEKVCDLVSITINKNAVPGDVSALNPGGVRLGTCALTTRGVNGEAWGTVAGFLDEAVKIALKIQGESGKGIKEFVETLGRCGDLEGLRKRVEDFAKGYFMPGLEEL